MLTCVSPWRWSDTECLLAIPVRLDSRALGQVLGHPVSAFESAAEDALRLDADVDAHRDNDGEEE